MNTWVKIGLRNLLKNKRRSLFTLGAIALGYAAVNVFGGFTQYLFRGMKDSYIYAQAGGHLNIFRKGFSEQGTLDPRSFLLSSNEIVQIRTMLSEDPRILVVTPQLSLQGLVSNGDISTIFVANGSVPEETAKIRMSSSGLMGRIRLYDGRPLEDDNAFGLGIGSGMARMLGLSLGSPIILMAPTISGQMNALDAEVFFTFDAGAEQLNDKMVVCTLSFARLLYDTDSAERLVVLLSAAGLTQAMREELETRITEAGIPVEIRTWRELAPSYDKTSDMFNVIFSFVFIIVFIIVVLSIINTISMAVLERTREIGTLRSLGLKRRGVMVMFATESAILAVLGSVLGMLFTVAVWALIKLGKPTWMPPTLTKRVPLEIRLVPEYLVVALLFMLVLSAIAAILPARRAARMSIVDALGHV